MKYPTAPDKIMNEPHSSLSKRRTPYWVLISGFWMLITLATALQDWLTHQGDFVLALRFAGSLWLPWAFITPGIAWFSAKFPVERDRWRRRLAGHFFVCAVISVLFGLLSHWVGPPPFHRPAGFKNSAGNSLPADFMPPPPAAEMILHQAIFQLPIYWAIVGVAHAFVFYERARERERHAVMLEAGLAKARLLALQMQLNPHFLFNTLNSIASLVQENPGAAYEMIGSLSDFLRLTLQASERSEVTLREELKYLDHYLTIEQIRFNERLRVEKQIDSATLDALVPMLILQPLLENTIKHGVEKQLAPVLVSITAKRDGDYLQLTVADDGCGLKNAPSDWLKEGVGLSNARARLREVAGAAGSLDIRTPPTGGLVAEIRIPWRSESATDTLDSPVGRHP